MRFEMRADGGLGGSNGGWYSDWVVPINEWTHLAVSYNKDSASNDPTFYMNGVAVPLMVEYDTPVLPFYSDVNCDLHLGTGNAGWSPMGNGIDEIGFWSSTLSATEVLGLYEFSIPEPTYADNLVGQWLLGEGSGSVVYDTSGNENHGAITGAAYSGGYIGAGLGFSNLNEYVTIPSDSIQDQPKKQSRHG